MVKKMKKIITIILLLISIENIKAGNLYVSKKDIDTKEYINDCDFLLYDENNNPIITITEKERN